jgi:CMP-N-acetylneuraminate monooxygenase
MNINDLSNGINIKGKYIIYKNTDKSIIVSKNECIHNSGKFIKDIEDDIVKCVRHGWKYNAKTLEYTNPPDCLKQCSISHSIINDILYIDDCYSKKITWPDAVDFIITYFSHACIEIKLGSKTLITDPWIVGPAFGGGWWPTREAPENAIYRIANSDGIFISHSHSDHFNINTLRKVYEINPNVYIFSGLEIFNKEFQSIGFKNYSVVAMDEWLSFGDAKILISPDSLYPNLDTFLLVSYRDKKLVNLVDCCSPNGIIGEVDVVLSDFASGSSAFPSCYYEMYGEETTRKIASEKAKKYILKLKTIIENLKPKVWIPFAGDFTESRPGDEKIRELNLKNSPYEASRILKDYCKDLTCWIPFPGYTYDVLKNKGHTPEFPDNYIKNKWDFETYIEKYDTMEINEIKKYYDNSGFSNYELILHIIEMCDNFDNIYREYYVDFSNHKPLITENKTITKPYIRMKVRQSSMNRIYATGKSWDDIFIGFSSRLYVEPDVFHMKFFNHFQNCIQK